MNSEDKQMEDDVTLARACSCERDNENPERDGNVRYYISISCVFACVRVLIVEISNGRKDRIGAVPPQRITLSKFLN